MGPQNLKWVSKTKMYSKMGPKKLKWVSKTKMD